MEEQGVGAFSSVFRQDAYQQEVDDIGLVELQGTDDMPPAKGEKASVVTFLQGLGERGNGDTHTDNGMVRQVPVLNDTEHIHVEELEILLHIDIYLVLGHLRIAIEMAKGLVDHIEHLLTILLRTKDLTALQARHMQIIA